MKKKTTRIISLIMAMVMIVGMLPTVALAAPSGNVYQAAWDFTQLSLTEAKRDKAIAKLEAWADNTKYDEIPAGRLYTALRDDDLYAELLQVLTVAEAAIFLEFLEEAYGLVMVYGSAPKKDHRTGISTLWDNDLQALGFTTDSVELQKQAKDPASPYGNGNTAVVSVHELLALGGNSKGESIIYDYKSDISKSPQKTWNNYDNVLQDAIAARSVAFDPMGDGKDNFVAILWAEYGRTEDETHIFLHVAPNTRYSSYTKRYTQHLVTLPFKLYPENAGAYLSITAGNFDGDDRNTEEIALYHPYYSTKTTKIGGKSYNRASGTIDVYKISTSFERNGAMLQNKYTASRIACYELLDRSKYYFYDNSVWAYLQDYYSRLMIDIGWKMMYYIPQVGVEAVSQPGDKADDLCITYSPAMGGKKQASDLEGVLEIDPKRPYDSATSVFFWIDPATKNDKSTGVTQMRWQWKSQYDVPKELDKKTADKYEVMTFGGAGSGDVNDDGYNEVVVAGYRFQNHDEVWDGDDNGDWNFAEDEYLATYFTYDAEKNTYKHCGSPANWVNAADGEDNYADAYDQLEGMYHNIGEKDTIHNPLTVECFADKGDGYAEAVAVGGIIAYLDNSGVSTCLPDNKKFAAAYFEAGAFNGVYAIPIRGIQKTDIGEDIQNRFFVELVAGNFNGNLLGKEHLAFAYTAKKDSKDKYYSFYGIIGQIKTGNQDHVQNVKRKGNGSWDQKHYIDSKGLEFELYTNTGSNERWRAPITISAVDCDNDSYIMRRADRPNEHFFSDPQIIAVLQGAPYFKEIDYGANNGNTTFTTMKGKTEETAHGVSAGLAVQAGFSIGSDAGLKLAVVGGVSADYAHTWGKGWGEYYSLSFESAEEDCVALVMAPTVRYHYDVYDPTTKKWEPMEVDVSQIPRASIITVESYDQVAKDQGWDLIRGDILPDNDNDPNTPYVYGDPNAYYEKPVDLRSKAIHDDDGKYFYGATTSGYGSVDDDKKVDYGADDYVKLGVSNGSSITQAITMEKTKSTNNSWDIGMVDNIDLKKGVFALSVEVELGYTGSKTVVDLAGTEYEGKVVSVPVGYEDYTFAWRFGYWNDSLKVVTTNAKGEKKNVTQTFPVLGYLVTDIQQPVPPIEDPMLHISRVGSSAMTLTWKANSGAVNGHFWNDGFILCRKDQDVYYPLATVTLAQADENGWCSFTDRYAEAYSKYSYALRPFAYIGGKVRYGEYISMLDGFTTVDKDNMPKVTVKTEKDGNMQILTAIVTPASEGDVGPAAAQWQRYVPEEGGWQDIESTGPTLSIGANEDSSIYRCRVTQRVETKIYTVYSNSFLSGYVFVAGRSSPYESEGKTVVDYALVHEDGTVLVASSDNTHYNTKYVYNQTYDETGMMYLALNDNTAQRRSVSAMEGTHVEVEGGNAYRHDSGHEFEVVTASQVWDVTRLAENFSGRKVTLLENGADAEDVADCLAGYVVADALQVDDHISYSYKDGDLRAAFIFDERVWVEPSDDDEDPEDSEDPGDPEVPEDPDPPVDPDPPEPPPECDCEIKCIDGDVNGECSVCAEDHSQCTGAEPECICDIRCEGEPLSGCIACVRDINNCDGIVPEPPPVCDCEIKCIDGDVNAECPVCAEDHSQCTGAEPECICDVRCEGEPLSGCIACVRDINNCDGIVPEPPPECDCEIKCIDGDVNAECPVCAEDHSQCTGAEPECICDVRCEGEPLSDCIACVRDINNCDGIVPEPPPVCDCEIKCIDGDVNGECPVCADDHSQCTGVEPECICDIVCIEGDVDPDCIACIRNMAVCKGEEPLCICESPCVGSRVNADCIACVRDTNACSVLFQMIRERYMIESAIDFDDPDYQVNFAQQLTELDAQNVRIDQMGDYVQSAWAEQCRDAWNAMSVDVRNELWAEKYVEYVKSEFMYGWLGEGNDNRFAFEADLILMSGYLGALEDFIYGLDPNWESPEIPMQTVDPELQETWAAMEVDALVEEWIWRQDQLNAAIAELRLLEYGSETFKAKADECYELDDQFYVLTEVILEKDPNYELPWPAE